MLVLLTDEDVFVVEVGLLEVCGLVITVGDQATGFGFVEAEAGSGGVADCRPWFESRNWRNDFFVVQRPSSTSSLASNSNSSSSSSSFSRKSYSSAFEAAPDLSEKPRCKFMQFIMNKFFGCLCTIVSVLPKCLFGFSLFRRLEALPSSWSDNFLSLSFESFLRSTPLLISVETSFDFGVVFDSSSSSSSSSVDELLCSLC